MSYSLCGSLIPAADVGWKSSPTNQVFNFTAEITWMAQNQATASRNTLPSAWKLNITPTRPISPLFPQLFCDREKPTRTPPCISSLSSKQSLQRFIHKNSQPNEELIRSSQGLAQHAYLRADKYPGDTFTVTFTLATSPRRRRQSAQQHHRHPIDLYYFYGIVRCHL